MSSSFNTGMAHMQSAIDEGKKRSAVAQSGGSGKSLNYINWKPGDKKILRFLTDDVMTEEFADFIVDNTGQTKNFLIPSNNPHILDRYKSPTPGIGWRRDFKTGALGDVKLRKMGLGIAVLRDEQPSSETGKLELQDYLYEQDIDGSKYLSRHFGIVQQSVSNFWHTLAVSCFKRFGTICDRDYEITREGNGLDTKYSIIPLDPIPELATPDQVQAFYHYGYQWNNEDPDRFLKCPQTLPQWAEYFSSEERVKYWLSPDPKKPEQKTPPPASYSPQSNPLQTAPKDAWKIDTADEPTAAAAPTGKPASTNFSSFADTLLSKAKAQQPPA